MINPWKLFDGVFVPMWLLEIRGISPGAKLCYARLCRYAGEAGVARPKQETLAKELGVEPRQCQRYLSELKKADLIQVDVRGLAKANEYRFYLHPNMGLSDVVDTSDVTYPETTHVTHPNNTEYLCEVTEKLKHPRGQGDVSRQENGRDVNTSPYTLLKALTSPWQWTNRIEIDPRKARDIVSQAPAIMALIDHLRADGTLLGENDLGPLLAHDSADYCATAGELRMALKRMKEAAGREKKKAQAGQFDPNDPTLPPEV